MSDVAAVLTLVIPSDTAREPSVSVSVNLDSFSLTPGEAVDRALVWLEAHRSEVRGAMRRLAMASVAGLN